MKILYSYTEGIDPIYLDKINGVQRVLLMFQDSGKTYVYFCDDYLRHTYLNIVLDFTTPLCTKKLGRVEDDKEFYYYLKYIESNYNYNGVHVEEKITGHDQGGHVLIDLQGNPIIK